MPLAKTAFPRMRPALPSNCSAAEQTASCVKLYVNSQRSPGPVPSHAVMRLLKPQYCSLRIFGMERCRQ